MADSAPPNDTPEAAEWLDRVGSLPLDLQEMLHHQAASTSTGPILRVAEECARLRQHRDDVARSLALAAGLDPEAPAEHTVAEVCRILSSRPAHVGPLSDEEMELVDVIRNGGVVLSERNPVRAARLRRVFSDFPLACRLTATIDRTVKDILDEDTPSRPAEAPAHQPPPSVAGPARDPPEVHGPARVVQAEVRALASKFAGLTQRVEELERRLPGGPDAG